MNNNHYYPAYPTSTQPYTAAASNYAAAPYSATGAPQDDDKVIQHILELTSPATREQALLELSKKREAYENLAPILWHSFGRGF